jgi:hypothetical protein
MSKVLSTLTILCICLMSIMEARSYANPVMKPLNAQEKLQMQEHVEKVRINNPGKYQIMIEKAGGNVTDCCSCHKELCSGSIGGGSIVAPPGMGPTNFPQK